jgi:hypothetical protein
MITYVIDNYNYSEFKHRFCRNFTNPIKLESLTDICRKSCAEVLYEIWFSDKAFNRGVRRKIQTSFHCLNVKSIAFEHKPEMEFMQYLVNFGGLLGLWSGLSLSDLKNLIINLFKAKIIKYNGMRRIRKYFLVLKSFKKTNSFLNIKVGKK